MADVPPARWPTAAIDATAVLRPSAALLVYRGMPTFDIRNGRVDDACSIFIKASIPAHFHWAPVGGLDPADAMLCLDAFVRAAVDQMAAAPLANSTRTDAQNRKVAIVLGISRAVMTCYYRLLQQDMIQGEVVAPRLVAVRDADGMYTFSPVQTASDVDRQALSAPITFTEEERAVIPTIVASAIGVPPLQGYSLAMTAHHYLSDPNGQSRKAYAAVEKQFWRDSSVEQWFAQDLEIIQDALWHKSGHPISMSLKETLAYDERVAAMLVTAGSGSAAARLPAIETDARAASSYRTLFATCKPLFEICGGTIDFSLLDIALDTLKLYPPGRETAQRPVGMSDRVPATVNSRTTARAWLKTVVERNASNAALCFGFYCTLVEQSQAMLMGGGADTLRSAFSLKKLMSSSHAAYIQGVTLYGDYTAARQALRARGEYFAPTITIG